VVGDRFGKTLPILYHWPQRKHVHFVATVGRGRLSA
jgi:hypothetical protein